MPYTPPYPKPLDSSSKRSFWNLFKRSRKSWLATLYEGSYKGSITRVRLPGSKLFLVKLPELIRGVLIDRPEAFPKHEIVESALKPLLGESLITTNGPLWERQRRMVDPAFGQAKLKEVFTLMRGGSDALLGRLDQAEDGELVDMEIEMTHVTADVILRTIFSEPLEGEGARKIFHSFNLFQEKAVRMIQMGFLRLPLWLAPRTYFTWKRAGREIREILTAMIKERHDAYQRGEKSEHKDILQSLLETRDPEDGSAFTFSELVDQVAVLFLAGHETSASSLSWSMFLIAKCPEIQERMHRESVSVLARREPEFRDVSKLKMARNVFREALRLYPPVGFLIFRKSVGTQKVGKYEMPEGSPVAVSPWLVHRHRDLWERPDEFDPDRFDGGLDQPKCAYIPFGQGPRICIGAAFAMQEAMLVLAELTRRYRLEPDPAGDPEPTSRITIRSLDGIRLRVYRRPVEDVPEVGSPNEEDDSAEDMSQCPFHS